MKFKLNIDCDNAAFQDDASHEVARILRELADRVEISGGQPLSDFNLYDTNGNRVGEAKFTKR